MNQEGNNQEIKNILDENENASYHYLWVQLKQCLENLLNYILIFKKVSNFLKFHIKNSLNEQNKAKAIKRK